MPAYSSLVFLSRLVSILRFSSEERTLAREPVFSGCSIVSERGVLDNDRRIEGGEVDLVDLLANAKLRLENHATLSEALSSEMFLIAWLSDRFNRASIWAWIYPGPFFFLYIQ